MLSIEQQRALRHQRHILAQETFQIVFQTHDGTSGGFASRAHAVDQIHIGIGIIVAASDRSIRVHLIHAMLRRDNGRCLTYIIKCHHTIHNTYGTHCRFHA